MKISILSVQKTEMAKKELPSIFKQKVRPDIVKRAVLALRANSRQAYGADKRAGMKQLGDLSRRRHDYKGSYGHGISRVQRKILTHRGTRFFWVGAVVPGTVGGRRAHPPKAEKNWKQKINKKEKRAALQSVLSASMIKAAVVENGHKVPDNYPFLIEGKFETLEKTKDVIATLKILGFGEELQRTAKRKIQQGRAKIRGRKYKKKCGPLLVVSEDCMLQKAAKNIPGVEVTSVKNLNTIMLTHGIKPGRLTLFTDAAIEEIGKLFDENKRNKKE